MNKIIQGDCLEEMKKMDANSIDTIITDPPAGISFMNKAWDDDRGGRDEWIKWFSEVMSECYRLAKPGATALVWAIPRTSHWTATAIENAGFQIKDIIIHIFGSGFPKSHNIGKSTNKKEWEGYGTALKPASEHWIVAIKSNDGTYANNALKWGVSGLNIDGGRIGSEERTFKSKGIRSGANNIVGDKWKGGQGDKTVQGRFPANIILECICDKENVLKQLETEFTNIDSHNKKLQDKINLLDKQAHINPDCPCYMLDEQSGESKSQKGKERQSGDTKMFGGGHTGNWNEYNDKGGASRFFKNIPLDSRIAYVPKASKSDRSSNGAVNNIHPTCKPTKLCEYLATLTATPTKGVVLDPFCGSGSILIGAKRAGRDYIGIDMDKEYIEIAKKRLDREDHPKLHNKWNTKN